MLRLIFAVVLLLVAAVLMLLGTKDIKTDYGKTSNIISFRRWALIPLGLGFLFLLLACIRVVSPGEVGIPVVLGDAKAPIQSGISFTNPLASVKKFSIRTEEYTMSKQVQEGVKVGDDSVEVLGQDGATGKVDATLLHRLNRDDASNVYRSLGIDYVNKIIRPTSRTCIRDAFAGVTMVAAATTERQQVAEAVQTCIKGALEPRGLVLESFQLRDVTLSDTVQNAINSKVEAEQRSAQQAFELEKTRQQAEIRRVESGGLADSQRIIQATLTPEYLQYEFIKAMTAVASSPNHSTLIMPYSGNLAPQFVLPNKP